MPKIEPETYEQRLAIENAKLRREVERLRDEVSWHGYVDTASGAFRPDEIERARNGGYQGG